MYTENDKIVQLAITESITSNNADLWKNNIERLFDPASTLELDVEQMSYISSAGLRVLLTFQKRLENGNKVRLINVSDTVMNVMQMSGFSEIIEVVAAPRQISLSDCKFIAKGGTGECYQIDDESVVKLYYEYIPDSFITMEKNCSKAAFVAGIPTAISYEFVRCGNRKGIVYEMIKAKTLAQEVASSPDRLEEFGKKYAQLAKTIHGTIGDLTMFPRWTDQCRSDVSSYDFLNEQEKQNVLHLLDTLENDKTYIHGDFNPNNIMVSNGELLLIDMGSFSIGSPLIDLASLYFTFCYNNNTPDDEVYPFTSLTGLQQRTLWKIFICEYFSVSDYEEAQNSLPQMKIIEDIVILIAMNIIPRFAKDFPKDIFDKVMRDAHRRFQA